MRLCSLKRGFEGTRHKPRLGVLIWGEANPTEGALGLLPAGPPQLTTKCRVCIHGQEARVTRVGTGQSSPPLYRIHKNENAMVGGGETVANGIPNT